MHTEDLTRYAHAHDFHGDTPNGERRVRAVLWLCAVMMVVEIVAGLAYGSMALLADGWHMATHVLAIGLAAAAYVLARRLRSDRRFAFGAWRIEVLAGYTSAILLGAVAVLVAVESVMRMVTPAPISFDQAIAVAVVGLVVNVVSAVLLHHGGGAHTHAHAHAHTHVNARADAHDHPHAEHHAADGADLNLRAAYLHVLADALTSILAIVALAGGAVFGWHWLDPMMGIVGSAIIALWAWGLARESATVLLDREMDHRIVDEIRAAIEEDRDARVFDLHLWRVGPGRFACALGLVADRPLPVAQYRSRLAAIAGIAHVTIEITQCESHST